MTTDTARPPDTRTWRDIPQQVSSRAMSAGGRRRVAMKLIRSCAGVAVLGACAWAAWAAASSMRDGSAAAVSAPPERGVPAVRAPILRTNGMLDAAWLARTLALPPGATLAELDMDRLRVRLLADPQVLSASLEKHFPDHLVVTVSERSPVARVMAAMPGAAPRPFLVARDGVVYAGTGTDPKVFGALPWLDGVKLVRAGAGYAPVDGMGSVADLIATARLYADNLSRSWHVLSLGRLASDGEIEVRTADGLVIVFASDKDFLRQVASLDDILNRAKVAGTRPLRVDLSLWPDVPVTSAPQPSGGEGEFAGDRESGRPPI